MVFFQVLFWLCVFSEEIDCEFKIEFEESSELYPFRVNVLPFPSTFLSPEFTAQVLYVHQKHVQQGYVDKLNEYLYTREDYQDNSLVELVDLARDDETLQKYAGGNYNHLLFWWGLTNSECAVQPVGGLLELLLSQWGSFEVFSEEFKQVALDSIGASWAWLCLSEAAELLISTTEGELNPLMEVDKALCYPVLGVDLWEHSWHLKYVYEKKSYLDAVWRLIDWEQVSAFYENYAKDFNAVPL